MDKGISNFIKFAKDHNMRRWQAPQPDQFPQPRNLRFEILPDDRVDIILRQYVLAFEPMTNDAIQPVLNPRCVEDT